jgi:hypothetical protein
VDDDGSTNLSAAAVVTIVSNQPPVVSIVSPTNGQTFVSPASITIESVASDSDGEVMLVEFFESTNKLGGLTNTPYLLAWTNVPSGHYAFTSVATDNRGARSTSLPVEITVNRASLALALVNPTATDGMFSFSFSTQPEWTFHVEFSDTLDSTNWMLVTNIVGDGSEIFIREFYTNQQKFYRVRAQ